MQFSDNGKDYLSVLNYLVNTVSFCVHQQSGWLRGLINRQKIAQIIYSKLGIEIQLLSNCKE